MADRYWVGGAGTWNTSSTTNWSASSGGASGASVPTAADSVIFDQAGTYTVTMTGALLCLDLTVSLGTVTFATGTTPTLAITGNMTLLVGTVWSSTGAVTFNATTTGKTITTNGVTISGPITLNGVGGGWTLGSALTMNTASNTLGLFTVTNGTFATGNFNMTLGAFASNNSNTRSVTLGTSAILASRWTFTTTTGLTFSGASSTINFTQIASGDDFNGGGLTYGTVALTAANTADANLTIAGANTFGTLSVAARTAVGESYIQFGANQTITTLTLSAPTLSARRIMLRSGTYGTQRTLTVTTITATVTDYDFRDLVISSATLSGTRIGNGGNCSGITFSTAKNVYWSKVAGGNWTDSDAWAATSGGVAASTNFPLMQDTAYIENTGLNTSTTVTIDNNVNLGSVDASGRTNAVALAQPGGYAVYGNFVMGSGVTLSGVANGVSFFGTAAQSITMNGVTFTRPLTLNKPVSGTVSLSSAFTSTSTVTLSTGTLDLQTYTLTATTFNSNTAAARTLAFGTGNIVVNGTGTVWITALGASVLTVTGTPTVNVSNTTATATTVSPGSPTEANSISFNFTTGTYALTFSAGSVRNLDFTGFAGTMANAAKTIYGNLTLAAAYTAGTNAWTFAATSGTKTITSNAFTIDWPLTFNGVGGTWKLQDALTMGSTRALTHTNGTLDLNGLTLTVGSSYTTATGTKNLTFNAGTLVCPEASATAFNNAVPTGFSTTAGTGTGAISMTAATAKTFVGGGSTFNCTLNQGGAGALTITGANTFTNIANTVQPASVLFTAATTNTFTNFNLNGSAGNLITIGSVTAASHTLSKASGAVSVDYVSISRSTATGGATWTAGSNSVDGGNNTGWVFSAAGYTITAANGTYAVTGQSVSIFRSKLITASNGTYAVTGQSAVITYSTNVNYALSALNGTYAVTGQSVGINRSKLITASNGTYAVTGQNITVLFSRLLSAQNGVYSVTGQPVSIVASGAPIPVAAIEYFIEIRSFTERRRF